MLIQFSARNFKSFKDPFTLDLFTNKETAVSNIIKSNFKNTYASAVFFYIRQIFKRAYFKSIQYDA